jgi:hypothetical protein
MRERKFSYSPNAKEQTFSEKFVLIKMFFIIATNHYDHHYSLSFFNRKRKQTPALKQDK